MTLVERIRKEIADGFDCVPDCTCAVGYEELLREAADAIEKADSDRQAMFDANHDLHERLDKAEADKADADNPTYSDTANALIEVQESQKKATSAEPPFEYKHQDGTCDECSGVTKKAYSSKLAEVVIARANPQCESCTANAADTRTETTRMKRPEATWLVECRKEDEAVWTLTAVPQATAICPHCKTSIFAREGQYPWREHRA